MDVNEKITGRRQAVEFCYRVYDELKINYHPDESFAEYADENFPYDVKVLDERMEECWNLLGSDIYDVCFNALQMFILREKA